MLCLIDENTHLTHEISDPPSAPGNFRATEVTFDTINLAWDKPQSDGGTVLTGYVLEIQEEGGDFAFFENLDSIKTKYLVKRLKEDRTYNFRIYAENKAGKSQPSTLAADGIRTKKKAGKLGSGYTTWTEFLPSYHCNVSSVSDKPSSPRNVKLVDVSTSSITISYEAPEDTGGVAITTYIIEIQLGNEEFKEVKSTTGDTYSVEITGLRPGTEYNIRVFAENEAGLRSDNPGRLPNPAATKPGTSE